MNEVGYRYAFSIWKLKKNYYVNSIVLNFLFYSIQQPFIVCIKVVVVVVAVSLVGEGDGGGPIASLGVVAQPQGLGVTPHLTNTDN